MGFYGKITNTSRTSFFFDKIYPNRKALKDAETKDDGIYAGRYVLVEYDTDVSLNDYKQGYRKDNILYTALPTGVLQPYLVKTDDLIDSNCVDANTVIYVLPEHNFDVTTNGITFYKIGSINETISNIPDYKYQNNKLVEIEVADDEEKYKDVTAAKYKIIYSPDEGFTSNSDNFSINYSIDKAEFGTSRGYDSTVWQKTYNGSAPQYVMIAELNSVVPTFDISKDAPTAIPMVPHFDVDSTNVYYKLHVQPTWGFRIKSASSSITTPQLNNSGYATSNSVLASIDTKTYPTDLGTVTNWKYNRYNKTSGENETVYLKPNSADDIPSTWENEAQDIPAAIYFNKAGFNPEVPAYSTDNAYEGWGNTQLGTGGIVTDQINLSPTGVSGHVYNSHDGLNADTTAPDIQELSIILPSIGDTIAKVWDVVYGDRITNTNDETKVNDTTVSRSTTIEWSEANTDPKRDGLRLVNAINLTKEYENGSSDTITAQGYNTAQVSTVAGAINSVHDLMGMIITDNIPQEDNWGSANNQYIYYDKTDGKYYRKCEIWNYIDGTEVTGGNIANAYAPLDPELKDWDALNPKPYYIDTNRTSKQDYIYDETFHPGFQYIPANILEANMEEVELTASYVPGKFYLAGTGEYPTSGLKYSYYEQDLPNAEQDINKIYYDLQPITQLSDDVIIYVPNNYYYSSYTPDLTITENNFRLAVESGNYYFVNSYSSTLKHYNFVKLTGGSFTDPQGPPLTDDPDSGYSGFLANGGEGYNKGIKDDEMQKCYFYKRNFILDSSFSPSASKVYYKLKDPQQGQGVNAYYLLVVTHNEPMIDPLFSTKDQPYVQGLYYARVMDVRTLGETVTDSTRNVSYYQELSENIPSILQCTEDSVFNIEYNYYTYNIDTQKYTYLSNFSKTDFENAKAQNLITEYYWRVKYYTIKKSYELVSQAQTVVINENDVIAIRDDQQLISLQQYEEENNTALYYLEKNPITNTNKYIKLTINNFSKSINSNGVQVYYSFKPSPISGTYVPNQYYYKTELDRSYRLSSMKQLDSTLTYYLLNENFSYQGAADSAKIYYSPNKYYAKDANDRYVFLTATKYGKDNYGNDLPKNDHNTITYYEKKKYCVKEDARGLLSPGAEWNPQIPIPDTITVAEMEHYYSKQELIGFSRTLNTMHGLILRINEILNEYDEYGRDRTTVKGALLTLNDIINKFEEILPNRPVIVNNYGQITSSNWTSKQPYKYHNYGNNTDSAVNNDSNWISMEINGDSLNPLVTFKHNSHDWVTTTGASDINNNGDTIALTSPIVDTTGHLVGSHTETVTLPYGFKTITPQASTSSNAMEENTTNIEADNTQDILTTAAGNKWIKLSGADDTLTIGHEVVSNTFGEQKSNSQDQTPKFGDNFNIPVITVDNAGHMTNFTTETVKIPGLVYTPDETEKNDVLINLSYNYDDTSDIGTFSATKGKVDSLIVQDYSTTGLTGQKLSNSMSIATSFGELQTQINNMDVETVGGQTGQYISSISETDGIISATTETLPTKEDAAVEGEFVSAVSQSNAEISVSRVALNPSITITGGTDTAAPQINVTVNSKSGTAQSLTTATTGLYGVTKLSNTYDSTNDTLAATGKAIAAAIEELDVNGETNLDTSVTIASWNEADGKINITTQNIKIATSQVTGLDAALSGKQNTIPANTYDAYGAASAVLGTDDDTADSKTINGLSLKIDSVIGTEDDTEEQKTINGLLAKINALEARIAALESPVEQSPEETPDTEPEETT